MKRRGRAVGALLVALVAAAAPEAHGSAAEGQCHEQSAYVTQVGAVPAAKSPLVLVHGFGSSSDAMGPVEEGLERAAPGMFAFRYFDFRDNATDWAARPPVAACLAAYVREVSEAHLRGGGDGRVFLAGHSMGGLAIRFAMDKGSIAMPIAPSQVAAVATIGTPHAGSLFGNTWLAQTYSGLLERALGQPAERTSDAAKCLAVHDRGTGLPAACAVPPWLPAGVPMVQVAATTTVTRTLFGVALYDIPLVSDGVVGVNSAHGYLTSTQGRAPRGPTQARNVACSVTSDETLALLEAARQGRSIPTGLIAAEVRALQLLWRDSEILAAITENRLSPDLEALLASELAVSRCSHLRFAGDDETLGQIAVFFNAHRRAPAAGASACGSIDPGFSIASPSPTDRAAETARLLYDAAVGCDAQALINIANRDETTLSLGVTTAEEAFAIPNAEDRFWAITRLLSLPHYTHADNLSWPNRDEETGAVDYEALEETGLITSTERKRLEEAAWSLTVTYEGRFHAMLQGD